MAVSPGDYEPGAHLVTMDNNATAITKGKLLKTDRTNGGVVLTTADADEVGPWFVAVETVTSTSQNVTCVVAPSKVWVTADGTIKVGEWVQAASATAGEVIAFTAPASYTNDTVGQKQAARQFERVVGRYLGLTNEFGERAVATDASDGDVILIRMGI